MVFDNILCYIVIVQSPANCGAFAIIGDMFDYNSTKWKRLARAVMRRDGYMCQLSKRYGKRVPAEVVHHIYPVDEYPEYAYEPWNLISLSRKMHNTLHDRNTDALTAEGIALMTRAKRNIPPGCL